MHDRVEPDDAALGSVTLDAQPVGQPVEPTEEPGQLPGILALAHPPQQRRRHPVGAFEPAEVGQRRPDRPRMGRPAVACMADVVEDLRGRLQYPLDEGLAAAAFRGDVADGGDHLRRGAPVNRANVTEQALELVAEPVLGVMPDRRRPLQRCRRHPTQHVRLQDVVARQRLAARVQHREHLMRAIDVFRDADRDMAPVEQELDEALAFAGVEIPDGLAQVVAHLDNPLCRR